MIRKLLIVFFGVLFVSACSDDHTGPLTGPPDGTNDGTLAKSETSIDVEDSYIVVFKDVVDDPDRLVDELVRGNGSVVKFRYRHALKGFAAKIPPQAIEGIRRNPNVAYVEADGIVHAGTQYNPPSWGLDRIDQRNRPLDGIYDYPNTGSGVTVYIIDSGIRFDHQEYYGRAFSGWDFVDNDPDASDCRGHGTHVAGTVGGSTVGVAKNVTLVAVRVLDCNGSGSYSGVIAGIDWVTANRSLPAVANMSLGGGYSASLNQAVANSIASGVVYSVSAGNDNADACTKSPASAPAALTIAASTSSDARASYSNYGTCVDLFAPGSGIYSSTMNGTNTYASWSGTSMAAPHVAGVAALYLSANPNATPTQVEQSIKSGATSGVLTSIGSGSPNLLVYNMIVGSPPQGTPPASPSGLNATAISSSEITLSWTDNSNDESGFHIEVSPDGSNWTQIASVGANVTSYSHGGLQASTSYHYRVRAYNTYGTSGYTNTAVATTQALPSSTSVYVAVADGSAMIMNRNKWRGQLEVTIRDEHGQVVSGAIVYVSWSGGTSGSGTLSTNSAGTGVITTGMLNNNQTVTMTVNDVTGTGIVYNSALNTAQLPVTITR